MQEEILYKKSRIGTSVLYFNTSFSEGEVEGSVPSVALLNNLGVPKYVNQFDGKEVWIRNSNNNWVRPNEFDVYYTGYSYSEAYSYVFNDQDKEVAKLQYYQDMINRFGSNTTSYIMFHDAEIDDTFVTTKLIRSRATLDTLNVYNNLTNSLGDQESDTGTLMGTLVARQNLRDEAGNKVQIPLANVPVGVFLTSDDFPDLNSQNNNGDRITFNLREGANQEEYFDSQSFTQDVNEYLRSGSQFDTIPNHYKLFTYTNENGEFVLNNVPTGSQVLMFEVDLFKQGLTKDEIALNNFPFPVEDNADLDKTPSLFYRQIPVEVIPTWGSFQTGYTEINVKVNLDLRKWVTFYTSPITYEGRAIEELQAKGYESPLTFEIRDMSLEGYPVNNKEIVEIHNMNDRDPDSRLRWYPEFAQRKRNAEFRTKGYHAFKLPANMYDPDGFKTDKFGNPTSLRGVWLAGYQIAMYYIKKDSIFRHTGMKKVFLDSQNFVSRDHFNLNINNETYTASNSGAQGIIGDFPYEKPWTPNYPVPYSIPRSPTQLNPNFEFLDEQGRHYIERPRYLDGDLVGKRFAEFYDSEGDSPLGGVGGYAVSQDNITTEFFRNNFSKTVTQNFIYKYERSQNEQDMYSNGYKPNDPIFGVDAGASSVLNGEQYQRVECGYGYWLRPEGMPRIANYPWWGGSEAMFDRDTKNPNQTVSISQATSNSFVSVAPYTNSIDFGDFVDGKRVSMEFGNSPSIQEGVLDIYRILDPSPYNLVVPDPAPVLQFVELRFGEFYAQRGKSVERLKPAEENSGNSQGERFWTSGVGGIKTRIEARLKITNKGDVDVTFEGYTLAPNQSLEFFEGQIGGGSFRNMILTLPTNSQFDFDEFKYVAAKYKFEWLNLNLYNGGNQTTPEGPQGFSVPINQTNALGGDENAVPKYYLRTRLLNCKTNYDDGSGIEGSGCKSNWIDADWGHHTIAIAGMAIVNPDQNKGGWYDSYFSSTPITANNATCGPGPNGTIYYQLA